ncbi:MAG: hypothetical protein JJE09_11095 [Bacteroidia bacterium]|nr:hypothetical protein [Bacteroidia bacterium]
MKQNRFVIALIVLGLISFRCDPFESLSATEAKLELPETSFNYNVVGATDQQVTLGRVLFYDPRLSVNNSVSCGSCHKQALAFSDNTQFSRGFENRVTARNSMPIQNIISFVFQPTLGKTESDPVIPFDSIPNGQNQPAGYLPGVVSPPDFFLKSSSLFWDGRETELESMVTRPIMNHIEMGIHDLEMLAKKLSIIPEYQPLFIVAFGEEEITSRHLALGLSSFLLSIRSNQSKFDRVFNPNINGVSTSLSTIEEQGRGLFFNKFNCNSCHELNGFANIGLDAVAQDVGQSLVTGNPQDAGKFKIPSLRNVQLTGPYMHDGRFNTLEDVLDHYSTGIRNSTNLDFRLRGLDGKAKQLNISASEKKAIIAFLNTLTDYEMTTDPKLSNPFRAN